MSVWREVGEYSQKAFLLIGYPFSVLWLGGTHFSKVFVFLICFLILGGFVVFVAGTCWQFRMEAPAAPVQDIWEHKGNPGNSLHTIMFLMSRTPANPSSHLSESSMLVWCVMSSILSCKEEDWELCASLRCCNEKSLPVSFLQHDLVSFYLLKSIPAMLPLTHFLPDRVASLLLL